MLQREAGGYVNRPGGPTEGAPHCPRCGSSVLTPTDEEQYDNEYECDLCGYVFPADEDIPFSQAQRIWEQHPSKAPERWDGVTHPATKQAAKPRYVITHDTYGRGNAYNDLERAKKELAHSVPAGEWYIVDRQTKEKVAMTQETTAMTHPHREAQLLDALEYATPREAVRITAELDGLRHAARLRREAGTAIDWDAVQSGVPGGPVPPGLHTAGTDWMLDTEPAVLPAQVRREARKEAQSWLLHADSFVLGHPEELEKQALDHAEVWSSRYANSNLAHRTFVASVSELLAGTVRVAADSDESEEDDPCAECGHSDAAHHDGPNADECTQCGCSYFRRYSKKRRTAASPDLRQIEQWCDTQGLVMKDFPDSLITRAAETGDTSILDDWLATNEPLTVAQWRREEQAAWSSVDTSRDFGYYD